MTTAIDTATTDKHRQLDPERALWAWRGGLRPAFGLARTRLPELSPASP